MEITIRCNSCDKELEVLVTRLSPGTDNVIFEVSSCANADCNDCRNCEDAKTMTRVLGELRELKTKLRELGIKDKEVANESTSDRS